MAGFLIFMMDSGDGQWWLPFIIITVLLFIFVVTPMWINDYKNAKNIIKGEKNEEEIKTSKNNLNLTIISSFI